MKLFFGLIALLLLTITFSINCQPNTYSTVEVGIVNPQPDKSYRLFTEIKTDSLSGSRLVDGMDFMSPDVTDLETFITNWVTDGDTLKGTFDIADLTTERFIIGGLVQVSNTTLKYSAMTVSTWLSLDSVEPTPAGFFFRRKR